MSRRATNSEPVFGSDSFLDVTTNLVGVLIILIVLVGLRVSKTPIGTFLGAPSAELERRLGAVREQIASLRRDRDGMEQRLDSLRASLSAKQAALPLLESRDRQACAATNAIVRQAEAHGDELRVEQTKLADARSRLVSFAGELDRLNASTPAPKKLFCDSPLSKPVESEELHFEVRNGRVAFVDLTGLMQRAGNKCKQMENEIREHGRATGDVGPVGGFRLKFTMARESMPYTQSLLYGNGSFRARLAEWQIDPVTDPRGEPIDAAIERGSQLDQLLARHSPNKFAVTLWTYPDSFAAFRLLRDHLYDRGYAVAARPLPPGIGIRGSVNGSRSFAQ